jgi:peptidoglycan/LPS O-acetylase OafA/YrhL
VCFIGRHQHKLLSATLALAAIVVGDCCTNSYGPAPDANHPAANPAILAVGFVFVTGLLQPLLPFCLLLLSCAGFNGLPSALSKLLSVRALSWVADVSYDVYLLHPLVIMAVWSALPPSEWFDPTRPLTFWGVTSIVIALSFVSAAFHKSVVSLIVKALSLRSK